jgi:hypothetical protein
MSTRVNFAVANTGFVPAGATEYDNRIAGKRVAVVHDVSDSGHRFVRTTTVHPFSKRNNSTVSVFAFKWAADVDS